MSRRIADVLADVAQLAPSLHTAGTFSTRVLEAIVRHASASPVRHSVETGSGASTILLSHLSADHTVFALDAGTGSIRSIENSPLLRRDVVKFVEGPTQVTIPAFRFDSALQLALIDGPHGYPFPDLEYFYLYPQLAPGALLVVDDIQIPTIGNLFEFLSADEMFDLQETVETTAFFRRTGAPTFPTLGDGWWTQVYNRVAHEGAMPELMREAAPSDDAEGFLFYLDRFGGIVNPLQECSLRVPRNEPLIVSGWAISTRQRRAASAVDLTVDGRRYRAAVRGFRADVAEAHGDQGYLRSGFAARFPAGFFASGLHEIDIRVVTGEAILPCAAARFPFEVL